MRYFVNLSYNGKNYNGWQIQPNAPSIQETISNALKILLKHDVNLVGCGRTDTGVHSKFYIAHFDSDNVFDKEKLTYKLNNFLPSDISIFQIKQVHNDAHARFDALSRTYEYHIHTQKNPFEKELSYYYKYAPLNVDSMNKATDILSEYQDFTSFSKLHTDVKTNNCVIYSASWKQHNHKLVFTIKADRFLRNMVRAIVGTLLDVGKGKISLNDFRQIIELKDRGLAGTSAPAHALFLTHVEYDDNIYTI